MKVNVNLLNGGVKYDTPTCELIELDTTATLCQASGTETGTFELPAWGEDDLGLNF